MGLCTGSHKEPIWYAERQKRIKCPSCGCMTDLVQLCPHCLADRTCAACEGIECDECYRKPPHLTRDEIGQYAALFARRSCFVAANAAEASTGSGGSSKSSFADHLDAKYTKNSINMIHVSCMAEEEWIRCWHYGNGMYLHVRWVSHHIPRICC